MNKNIVILIIIIILFAIYFIDKQNYKELFTYFNRPNYKNNKIVQANKLSNMLFIFHKLCDEHNVYYIIAYGTLLGAVRHWGMIPWDDDVDIIVFNKDRNKIYQILNIMREQYDYQVDNTYKLSRILFQDSNSNYFMDIFFVENINNKIVRTYTFDSDKILDSYKEYFLEKSEETEWWWNGFDFDHELINQRKKYIYDDMFLWGPKNPLPLLTHWYGPDCLTVCKTHYLKDHEIYVEQEIIENFGTLPEPQL
jgi:hypothetical protein